MQYCKGLLVVICLLITGFLPAQYIPIPLTGFNEDAVAESGPSSLATTSAFLDAAASNKVMYTESFRAFAGFFGGGLPDNGLIVNGPMTFQLAPYTAPNALTVYRNTTGNLDLVVPASYARIRLLCFATEANASSPAGAVVNVALSFTDGSTVNYVTGAVLSDWFNGTTNTVISGFGRCSRVATAPWGDDGYTSNPRMYYIDVTLNCSDIPKLVQRISISNVTTAGSNAPFPNVVVMAASGLEYSQTITPVIVPADCTGPAGSIALTVSGSSAPYTYSWSTTPVQSGATATGLLPGSYTCTITDAGGCVSSYTGSVPLTNNAAVTASAAPQTICAGQSAVLSATATTGTLDTWNWTPGAVAGNTLTVTPAATTIYTVTGTNAWGCSASASVTVTVNDLPAVPVLQDQAVCPGSTAQFTVQQPVAGITYNWFTGATGGTPVYSGTIYTINNVTAPATYYVEAVSAAGCSSSSRAIVQLTLQPVPAAPVVNGVTICSGTDATLQIVNPQTGYSYNWYSAAAAGTLLGTGTAYTISNMVAITTVYAEAVNAAGCASAGRQPVTAALLLPMASPVVTVTDSTFTSLSFSWSAIPGATGYEVTINGGISYRAPSSGSTGTTHVVNGLSGNQQVTIQVRALGGQPCETSTPSVPVTGTTLSTKEIFVPNVFTPNGDGKNDILYVYGNYISTIQFMVFNQWGQLLFRSENIAVGWDGRFKGQLQPVGVYAYTLRVVLRDGTVRTKKGSVNLIR